jgi:hypothetical protein
VVCAVTLATASLNGLVGIAPFVLTLTSVFASTVGSGLGAFVGEYRRVRGVPDEQVIEDIQQTAAAVVDPMVEAQLFRDGTEDLVSRYKLNTGLTNIVLRYHDGLPISRKRMTDDKVIDQRYWNLCYEVLEQLGMVGSDTRSYKSKGDAQLDLEFIGRRWRVSMGQEVWVLPEVSEAWQRVDLYACTFLRRKETAEKTDSPA